MSHHGNSLTYHRQSLCLAQSLLDFILFGEISHYRNIHYRRSGGIPYDTQRGFRRIFLTIVS
jgi:hypothetical protein